MHNVQEEIFILLVNEFQASKVVPKINLFFVCCDNKVFEQILIKKF